MVRLGNSKLMGVVRLAGVAGVLCGAGMLAMPPEASATNGINNAWRARYPTSTLPARMNAATGSACNVCHHPTNTANAGNCYKEAIAARINGGMTSAQAIIAVEGLDSDNDGVANGVEILAARTDIAGAIGYSPGLRGATGTDPCGTNPNTAVSNQLETPPAEPQCHGSCVADFDDGSRTGTPDESVTIDDLLYYLGLFEAGDSCGDIDDGSGTGTQDQGVGIADLVYFLVRFEAGC